MFPPSKRTAGNDEEDDGNRSAAKLDIPEGVEVFDVKGPFFFGAVEQFKDQVLETLEHDTKVVILRMRWFPRWTPPA